MVAHSGQRADSKPVNSSSQRIGSRQHYRMELRSSAAVQASFSGTVEVPISPTLPSNESFHENQLADEVMKWLGISQTIKKTKNVWIKYTLIGLDGQPNRCAHFWNLSETVRQDLGSCSIRLALLRYERKKSLLVSFIHSKVAASAVLISRLKARLRTLTLGATINRNRQGQNQPLAECLSLAMPLAALSMQLWLLLATVATTSSRTS